jgi:hypothetical protein
MPGDLAGIALSTNGRQVIAHLCNGTSRHVSAAQWFTGPVTRSGIDITNVHGAHLVAAVTARAITGAVTLNDGRSASFTARLLPDPGSARRSRRSWRSDSGCPGSGSARTAGWWPRASRPRPGRLPRGGPGNRPSGRGRGRS